EAAAPPAARGPAAAEGVRLGARLGGHVGVRLRARGLRGRGPVRRRRLRGRRAPAAALHAADVRPAGHEREPHARLLGRLRAERAPRGRRTRRRPLRLRGDAPARRARRHAARPSVGRGGRRSVPLVGRAPAAPHAPTAGAAEPERLRARLRRARARGLTKPGAGRRPAPGRSEELLYAFASRRRGVTRVRPAPTRSSPPAPAPSPIPNDGQSKPPLVDVEAAATGPELTASVMKPAGRVYGLGRRGSGTGPELTASVTKPAGRVYAVPPVRWCAAIAVASHGSTAYALAARGAELTASVTNPDGCVGPAACAATGAATAARSARPRARRRFVWVFPNILSSLLGPPAAAFAGTLRP